LENITGKMTRTVCGISASYFSIFLEKQKKEVRRIHRHTNIKDAHNISSERKRARYFAKAV